MGLQKHAHALGRRDPAFVQQMIRSVQVDTVQGWREQVYVFQGTHVVDGAIIHKVGRSRLPDTRIKQIRSRMITIRNLTEVTQITCCSAQRMHPSPADTFEKLLHSLFAPYQVLRDCGKEYFQLPVDCITFLEELSVIDALALNITVLNTYYQ